MVVGLAYRINVFAFVSCKNLKAIVLCVGELDLSRTRGRRGQRRLVVGSTEVSGATPKPWDHMAHFSCYGLPARRKYKLGS